MKLSRRNFIKSLMAVAGAAAVPSAIAKQFISNAVDKSVVEVTTPLVQGAWNHIAVVRTSENVTLYLNGKVVEAIAEINMDVQDEKRITIGMARPNKEDMALLSVDKQHLGLNDFTVEFYAKLPPKPVDDPYEVSVFKDATCGPSAYLSDVRVSSCERKVTEFISTLEL